MLVVGYNSCYLAMAGPVVSSLNFSLHRKVAPYILSLVDKVKSTLQLNARLLPLSEYVCIGHAIDYSVRRTFVVGQ